MTAPLTRLSRIVTSKLRSLGCPSPSASTIATVLNIVYLASLTTEEGRFVRGSLTFADPHLPDAHLPPLRRAHYPAFTPFSRAVTLTVESLVKLSRAVDSWCGSVAVYGKKGTTVRAWGVLDQTVQHNVRLHREGQGGFSYPGIVTVVMDGVGSLSVYHRGLFLGGLQRHGIVVHEHDALRSPAVAARIVPAFRLIASRISEAVGKPLSPAQVERDLFDQWCTTIARICIGLRRGGAGGALLISPRPIPHLLEVSHPIDYRRLGHSGILGVLDSAYLRAARDASQRSGVGDLVPIEAVHTEILAEADADDREKELTGAVRLVTSLAALDGLVLLTPLLEVVGFGVKIRTAPPVGRVYDGNDFARRGAGAKRIDASRFGTRHSSMLGYCRADGRAIGVVVSQDGQVRLVVSLGRSLTLWDNVKLLSYDSHLRTYRIISSRARRRPRQKLGYTRMPKSVAALMRWKSEIRTK